MEPSLWAQLIPEPEDLASLNSLLRRFGKNVRPGVAGAARVAGAGCLVKGWCSFSGRVLELVVTHTHTHTFVILFWIKAKNELRLTIMETSLHFRATDTVNSNIHNKHIRNSDTFPNTRCVLNPLRLFFFLMKTQCFFMFFPDGQVLEDCKSWTFPSQRFLETWAAVKMRSVGRVVPRWGMGWIKMGLSKKGEHPRMLVVVKKKHCSRMDQNYSNPFWFFSDKTHSTPPIGPNSRRMMIDLINPWIWPDIWGYPLVMSK